MPKMPPSHATGRRSAVAVQKLFIDAGCAVDVIVSDYGEDLYIQPQLRGEADNFHILMQVKTVSRRTRSVVVDLDHLRRWANMINPVFLAGYDEPSKRVHVIGTQHLSSRWELLNHIRRTKSF